MSLTVCVTLHHATCTFHIAGVKEHLHGDGLGLAGGSSLLHCGLITGGEVHCKNFIDKTANAAALRLVTDDIVLGL